MTPRKYLRLAALLPLIAVSLWYSEKGRNQSENRELQRPNQTADRSQQPASATPGKGPIQDAEEKLLENSGYTAYYNENLRNPVWVGYELEAEKRSPDKWPRPRVPFQTDARTSARVDTKDFTNSGYTRGHMAPSFAIGAFHGKPAQLETFLLSNICPQTEKCNAGVWNSIERMEADDFAMRFGSIQTVTGPVFNDPPDRLPSGIAIPAGFFKVIMRPDGQTIAFLVPQNPGSPKPEDYLTSPGNIQKLTGIDLHLGPEETERTRTKIW